MSLSRTLRLCFSTIRCRHLLATRRRDRFQSPLQAAVRYTTSHGKSAVDSLSNNNHSGFPYKRLNWAANEIRLIEIYPLEESSNESSPVQCSIRHASLDDRPRYLALSYAWGNVEQTEPLVVNGMLFKITKSLDLALRRIRRMMDRDGKLEKMLVWADALSINQKDDIEKTWQVRQMGSIFHGADLALVWLGELRAGEEALRAMDKHSDLAGATLSQYDIPTAIAPQKSRRPTLGSALAALFRLPWWKRAWIVQEFSFGKKVLFACGDSIISSTSFFVGLKERNRHLGSIATSMMQGEMRYWRLYQSDYRDLMKDILAIHDILRLFDIRHRLKDSKYRNFSMWELLSLKRSRIESTDPRDMVYALTGISADASKMHLYPDYTRSVQHVYTETARALLSDRRMRMLWFCSQPRVVKQLPSWVPDWSSNWHNEYRYLSGDGGYGNPITLFSASGASQPVVSFSRVNSHQLLHLSGYRVDAVKSVGSIFQISSVHGKTSNDRSTLSNLPKTLQQTKDSEPDDVDPKRTDLWITYYGRSGSQLATASDISITSYHPYTPETGWPIVFSKHGGSEPPLVYQAFMNRVKELWELQRKHDSTLISHDAVIRTMITDMEFHWNSDGTFMHWRASRELLHAIHEELLYPQEDTDDLRGARLSILYRHNQRRPFITSEGRLGLGPAGMAPGDLVVVFFGTELPFIIRPDGAFYRIIGEAYVHGIMDSEATAMNLEAISFAIK